MKYHDFMESTYVRTNIALQVGYSPYGQGKVQAVQGLIHAQRKVLTWVNYAVVLLDYVLVLARLKKAPKTAHDLVESLKQVTAQNIANQEAQMNQARQAAIQVQLAAQQDAATLDPANVKAV